MHDKEAIEMMSRCLQEIEDLRNQREFLSPRAEAYEIIRDVVRMSGTRGGVMSAGESISWTLKKKIAELQEKIRAESPSNK